jgi:hypothetical protein
LKEKNMSEDLPEELSEKDLLPWEDRFRLKVLLGSLRMIANQVRDLPVYLHEGLGLPPNTTWDQWIERTDIRYNTSENLSERVTDRATTKGE